MRTPRRDSERVVVAKSESGVCPAAADMDYARRGGAAVRQRLAQGWDGRLETGGESSLIQAGYTFFACMDLQNVTR